MTDGPHAIPDGWEETALHAIPDEWEEVTPQAPSAASAAISGAVKGIGESLRSAGEGLGVLNKQNFRSVRPEAADRSQLGQIISTPLEQGWRDPVWWSAHIGHMIGGGAPVYTGAAIGALAGPLGAIGGGALGAALQTLVPSYRNARSEGLNHDAAVDRAMAESGIAGAAAGAMTAAPGASIFGTTPRGALRRPISEALAQTLGVQPAIGAAQQGATNLVEGKPVTQGTGEAAIMGAAAGVPFVAAHAVGRAAEGFTPRGPQPQQSGTAAGPQPNPTGEGKFWSFRPGGGGEPEGGGAPGGGGLPPGGPPPAPALPEGRVGPASPMIEAPKEAVDAGTSPADVAQPSQLPGQAGVGGVDGAPSPAAAPAVEPAVGNPPPAQVGTRAAPARIEGPKDLEAPRSVVNTEPTPDQAEAGNYRKAHIVVDGLPISIENPKGSIRRGMSPDGTPWVSPPMPADYGYVKGTRARDGDQIDAFIGHDGPQPHAFVIDQHDPETGKFDEPKVLMHVKDMGDAARIYAASFGDGSAPERGLAIHKVQTGALRDWLQNEAKKPFPPAKADLTVRPNETDLSTSRGPEPSTPAAAAKEPVSTPSFEAWHASPEKFDKFDASKSGKASGDLYGAGTYVSELREIASAHGDRLTGGEGGFLYKTRVNADKAHFLDWDKPLKDQNSVVKSGLAKAFPGEINTDADQFPEPSMRRLHVKYGKGDVAKKLSAAGVEGVTYRGRPTGAFEEGKPEYLVYDPSKIDILERSGEVEQPVSPVKAGGPAPALRMPTREGFATAASNPERQVPVGSQEPDKKSRTLKNFGTEPITGYTEGEANDGRKDAFLRDAAGFLRTVEANLRDGRGFEPHKDKKGRPQTSVSTSRAGPAVAGDVGLTLYHPETGTNVYATIGHGVMGRGTHIMVRSSKRPGDQFATNGTGNEWFAPTKTAKEIADKLEKLTGKRTPDEQYHDAVGDVANDPDARAALDATLPPGSPPIDWSQHEKPEIRTEPSGSGGEPSSREDQGGREQTEKQPAKEPSVDHGAAKADQEGRVKEGEPHERIADHLIDKGRLTKKEAADITGIDPRDLAQKKKFDEAVELGVVAAARRVVHDIHADDDGAAYARLVKLYADQPILSARTSTSIAEQAYSTPAPLAFAAARLAGIGPKDDVLEPTAGNGMLLTTADLKNAVANEINAARRAQLETLGLKPVDVDATKPDFAETMKAKNGGRPFDGVIANPPFGQIKENGKNKSFDLSGFQKGYATREIDHVIALNALKSMADDGKAALILGGLNKLQTDREDGYRKSKPKREFFIHLYNNYNVVDHFTVDGDLYAKQGAAWPVDVIVIHGRGKSAQPLPFAKAPPIFSSWDALGEHLRNPGYAQPTGKNGEPRPAPAGNGPVDEERTPEPDVSSGEDTVGSALVGSSGAQRPEGLDTGSVRTERPDRGAGGRDASSTAGGGKPRGSRASGNAPHRDGLGETPDPLSALKEKLPPGYTASGPVGDLYRVEGPKGFGVESNDLKWLLREARKHAKANPPEEEPNFPPDTPSFYRAFTKEQRDRFAAASADNKQVANILGRRLDAMRAAGREPDRLAHLEKKLNDILFAIMGPAPVPGQTSGKAGGGGRGWTKYTDEMRKERQSQRKQWKEWQDKQKAEAPEEEPETPEEAPQPKQRDTETEGQGEYTPHAKHTQGLGTVQPRNMRDATDEALNRVEERHGVLDKYVADSLGMSIADIPKHFSGEQVDAIAMAIDSIERGGSFIVGDQTGVGKGRVNAAIIRYAIQKDLTPVFFTQKPNLYMDMARDLRAIGMEKYLGREPKILMTNNNQNIPIDEDRGVFLKSGGNNESLLGAAMNAGVLPDHDVLFSTYDQMNPVKNKETVRRQLMQTLASKAIFVFDEAHSVGIEKKQTKKQLEGGGAPLLGEFMRGLARDAKHVFYSSATYAKTPENMDFYSRTNMSKGVASGADLSEAIKRGGVPMQEAMAAMLAKDGQYIRRERSFDGIKYNSEAAPVDPKQLTEFARGLREVNSFSKHVSDIIKGLDQGAKAEGEMVSGGQGSGGAGVTSTGFSAVMHNLISQMLLSAKADYTADRVIESIKSGQRPIVALTNTMNSFIDQYMTATGAKSGDPATLTFNDLMKRYLEKTRHFVRRRPFSSESEKGYLDDEMLGPVGLAMFNAAHAYLDSIGLDNLPISPIDYIHGKVEKAGYRMGEVTGRSSRIDYSSGVPILAQRSAKDISPGGRTKTINGFNSGEIHGLTINAAGSTGLSVHDDAAFRAKWPKGAGQRIMFIAQPNPDINVHMQTLGRANRTGQVTKPEFVQVAADSPAEVRIASILQRKMASLNANTTASKKSALSAADVPDFLNENGDAVAMMAMAEDPEMHELLGRPFDDLAENKSAMAVLTGYLAMLDYDDQVKLIDKLTSDYENLMKSLEESGENTGDAGKLDLNARPLGGSIVVPKSGDSVFESAVHLGAYDVKSLKKPMRFDAVRDAMAEAVQYEPTGDAGADVAEVLKRGRERNAGLVKAAEGKFKDYYDKVIAAAAASERLDEIRASLNAAWEKINTAALAMPIGGAVSVKFPDETSATGFVTQFKRTGKTANPFAGSDWTAQIALPGRGIMTLPLSQIGEGGKFTVQSSHERPEKLRDMFDSFNSEMREKRLIATGNILAAYDFLGHRGKITHFTMEDGTVKQGIILPADEKATADDFAKAKGRTARTSEEVTEHMRSHPDEWVHSADEAVHISRPRDRRWQIGVASAKSVGGKYYLNRDVLDATAPFEFVKRGQNMVFETPSDERAGRVIDALIKAGARFKLPWKEGQGP